MPELGFFANCFNPRVPRGTRPIWERVEGDESSVSIHASRAGRDSDDAAVVGGQFEFQSTRPARDATRRARDFIIYRSRFNPRVPRGTRLGLPRQKMVDRRVSIHASRAGRDRTLSDGKVPGMMFQSTRPARDATQGDAPTRALALFQSTRPARDATPDGREVSVELVVSIHASRAGRDHGLDRDLQRDAVSIHASRAGRDGE